MSQPFPFPLESDLSDETLVDLVLRGETAFFAVLVRRHNQRLYRAVRAVLRDDHEAEDALQQAYLSAFRYLRSFQRRSRLSTWLFRIALREAFARLHRKRRHKVVHAELASRAPARPWAPEETAIGRQHVRLLEEAIDALPDAYRPVFVLREVQEMTTAEVAEALSLSEQNVRVRLHRARDLVRRKLSAYIDPHDVFWFAGERCFRMIAGVMRQLNGSTSNSRNESMSRALQ
jgi:RNA polymerase sigma-70 factor (ECF subfamily)